MISPTTISAVKELSILDVVSKYVTDLKKRGSNWSACSPFTNEKTPSFYVVPPKGIFKCFSSGKGGNGIHFVIEKFGLEYIDAVKKLAGDFGIKIEYEEVDPVYQDKIKLLHKINHATANLYATELKKIFDWPLERTEADKFRELVFNELIERRKFTHDTIVQWKIGFAPGDVSGGYTPSKWNFLSQTIIQNGYYAQGVELGLIKTKGEVNYDVFRNRIVYPIIDHYDQFVSFGGRFLGEKDDFNPKYLNGEKSPIYDKSNVLYGLNFADEAIRKSGFVNIMEGYADVISFHQAGFNNTVGTCGTALTAEQCKLLKKYTNRAVLIFDGDHGGITASLRSIDLLMQHGFMTSVLPMPSILTLKYEPSEKSPGPYQLPFQRETVFITHQTKDAIMFKHNRAEIELALADVAIIEKVDPDELVRMLSSPAIKPPEIVTPMIITNPKPMVEMKLKEKPSLPTNGKVKKVTAKNVIKKKTGKVKSKVKK